MKNITKFCFAVIMLLSFSSAVSLDNASIDVSVSLVTDGEWAGIDLNITEVNFGVLNLSNSSEDRFRTKYEIRSQGNINMSVTPILEDEDDPIFKYLEFSRTYTSGWKQIGNYSILMNRTYEIGEWSDPFVQSIQLDLGDYLSDGGSPFDIVNHTNKVIFWVMPRYD